jgi:hypothetical protein
VDEFMAAFNAKDNEGMQAAAAYPHIFCLPDGQVVSFQTASDFVVDFDQLIRDND